MLIKFDFYKAIDRFNNKDKMGMFIMSVLLLMI